MIVYDNKNYYFYSTLINDGVIFSSFGTKVSRKANDIVFPSQRHTDNIVIVSSENDVSPQTEADGIVTRGKNSAIGIYTADCVPILFVDKKAGIIGASHQGWKGTFKRLAQKMIKQMVDMGAQTNNIIAAIGPAIGGCCYRFYGERLEEFKKEFPLYLNESFSERNGEGYLDLSRLNYLQLRESGIPANHIDHFPFCTCCDSRFFSYQREGKIRGHMEHFIVKL